MINEVSDGPLGDIAAELLGLSGLYDLFALGLRGGRDAGHYLDPDRLPYMLESRLNPRKALRLAQDFHARGYTVGVLESGTSPKTVVGTSPSLSRRLTQLQNGLDGPEMADRDRVSLKTVRASAQKIETALRPVWLDIAPARESIQAAHYEFHSLLSQLRTQRLRKSWGVAG